MWGGPHARHDDLEDGTTILALGKGERCQKQHKRAKNKRGSGKFFGSSCRLVAAVLLGRVKGAHQEVNFVDYYEAHRLDVGSGLARTRVVGGGVTW